MACLRRSQAERHPPRQLGVIIRLKSDAEYANDLAPAILFSSAEPPPSAIGEYVLFLTVNRRLRNLDYEVRGAAGYARDYHYKQDQKDRSVEGKTVIPVRFSAQFPPGPAAIRIAGAFANDLSASPLEISYRFYHKPL